MTLTFDLWHSNSSKQGTKHVFPVNLVQICSAVQAIFRTQTKKSQTVPKTEPYAVHCMRWQIGFDTLLELIKGLGWMNRRRDRIPDYGMTVTNWWYAFVFVTEGKCTMWNQFCYNADKWPGQSDCWSTSFQPRPAVVPGDHAHSLSVLEGSQKHLHLMAVMKLDPATYNVDQSVRG